MTDLIAEDLQFWFYTRIFVDGQDLESGLVGSAEQVGLERAEAEAWLTQHGRLLRKDGGLELVRYDRAEAEPDQVYLDFEWMAHLLIEQAGLTGPALAETLGVIFKISPEAANHEWAEVQAQAPAIEDDD